MLIWNVLQSTYIFFQKVKSLDIVHPAFFSLNAM